jgi:hypothetical protein
MSVSLLAAALFLATTATTPKPPPMAAAEPPPAFAHKPADAVAVIGSCRVSKATCVDFAGEFAGGAAERRCKQLKGKYAAEACPADGLVATCIERLTGSEDRTMTRAYAPTTAKAARAECKKTARGVFLAR